MNKIVYSLLILASVVAGGCVKDNYPGATLSPYMALYDVRNLYKGQDLTLTTKTMLGADKITGVVVSDHSGGNIPAGLLIIQDARRLSALRGISIPIGDSANDYHPGDSVIVDVSGGVLKRVSGQLEITGITNSRITRVTTGNTIPVNRVPTNLILANPDNYESTLSVIVKGSFDPLPSNGEELAGNKVLNDGFGDIDLYTDASSAMASTQAPVSANYYGIVFDTIGADGLLIPQFRTRATSDIAVLSSTVSIAPAVITGFMSDCKGADGNYEYIQFMATQDINFAATPFAVVVTNNANASTPAGYPVKGWATGSMRTFKFSLDSGFAAKGSFFYVGGAGKMINGSGSTDISASNWIRAFDYTKYNGDGFGNLTTGLLANSGNAFGMAIFSDSAVDVNSTPVDVMFISTGGSLFTAGPPAEGYKITNTDFYDIVNPITLQSQPYYREGSNTLALTYNTADMGYFNMLGGVYSPDLGKWVKARTQTNVLLSKSSPLSAIEGQGSTMLK